MSTLKQYFRQKVRLLGQLASRCYIFTRKRLPQFFKAHWLSFLLGAVILFALIFKLAHYWLEKQALAFPNNNDFIEQSAGQGLADFNLGVGNLIHGSMPGVYQTQSPDPLTEQEIQEMDVVVLQEIFLASHLSPVTFLRQAPRDKIIEYEIIEGDSISTIAASFGLGVNTVLWANNLNEESIIQPGQKLVILPVSGVKHQVKNNETISTIAKKYQALEDKIIAFNSLPADGQIQEGQELIVPDGSIPAPPRPRIPSNSLAASQSRTRTVFADGKISHSYPFGYCTWYVAQRRYIPWTGHAKSWLANAQSYGFNTGKTPLAGAVMLTQETRRYGHVAYVESVSADGKWVTISEMNAPYFGKKTVRTLPISYPNIKGYIY